MRVRLINPDMEDGSRISSLELGAEYIVIGIEADWYRIVNDRDDPILFDPKCFEVTDATAPSVWQTKCGEDGEVYSRPEEWAKVGFFEDYHDGIEEVRRQFWADHKAMFGAG